MEAKVKVITKQKTIHKTRLKKLMPPDDSIVVSNAKWAVEKALEKKRRLGQPIAKFEPETGEVYIEYADGRIERVGNTKMQE